MKTTKSQRVRIRRVIIDMHKLRMERIVQRINESNERRFRFKKEATSKEAIAAFDQRELEARHRFESQPR
jgi:hypothetical protein